jgi:exodeoxyribonuclease V alpha subunit
MPARAHKPTLKATFNRVFVQFEGEGTRTIIGSVTPHEANGAADKLRDDGTATVKGRDDSVDLVPGIPYTFSGRWVEHHRHGWQFEFKDFVKAEPHDRFGLVKYLERYAYGVGPTIAARLWDAYGTDAVKTLRTDPERAASEIQGLSIDRAKRASKDLAALKEQEDTKIDLVNLFSGRGFPRALVDQVIRVWGLSAPTRIKRDPFTLLVHKFPGCGFNRCDRLYLDLGHPPEKLKRQMLCIWHYLKSDTSGHTWFAVRDIQRALNEGVSGATVVAQKAVQLGLRAGWLAERRDAGGQLWLAEKRKADNERLIAERIQDLSEWKSVRNGSSDTTTNWPDIATLPVSDHQRHIASLALSGPVGILSGGPGTGKTFTFAAIAREVVESAGMGDVVVVAPTGKAAVRCTSAMQEHGLEGLEATTIHRLLGVNRNGHDGQGWGFIHNRTNPLKQRHVFVDEASMLDTDTFSCLLDALQDGTHLLLIGDPFQLPPVGHGAPLRDLVAAGVPYGELTETHRNGGDIVRVCKELNEGRPYQPSEAVDVPAGHNVKHVEAPNAKHVMQVLRRLIRTCPAGIDATWDCQVLVAMNEKSDIARRPVNTMLQDMLNADGETVKGNPFRMGDKVICTSNTMLPLVVERGGASEIPTYDDDEEIREFVANGEIGRVVRVQPKLMYVAFDMPRRTVKVPMGDSGGTGCDFELGYAITTHKAQGSQAPVIITLIDDGAARVCSREWYVTAISRSEKLTITIGRRLTVDKHCKRVSLEGRKTFLRELLEAELEEVEAEPETTELERAFVRICDKIMQANIKDHTP